MIGARDVAFPELNFFSWYLIITGGLCTMYALIAGGVDTGWTFYTPFSTMFSNTHVIAAALGVFIAGFSSIASRREFHLDDPHVAGTGHDLVPPAAVRMGDLCDKSCHGTGDARTRRDVTAFDCGRWLHLPIFNPASGRRSATVSASVLVLQSSRGLHHGPSSDGCRLEVIHCFARRRVFGYDFMVYAMVGIAVIGFFVWGHHMFVLASRPMPASSSRSCLSSWRCLRPSRCSTGRRLLSGTIGFEAPDALCAWVSRAVYHWRPDWTFPRFHPVDVHVTDTYFVVAHFHYIMVGGPVSAYFAGLHYWWPKITGKFTRRLGHDLPPS